MRFVIATLPDVKFNLGRDLSLVKACALYGDECILFSPTYVGTEPFLSLSSRPLVHQLIYLALWERDPGFVVGEQLANEERAARIRTAKNKSDDLLSKAKTVLRILVEAKTADQAQRDLEKIALEIHPLVRAVERVFLDEKDFVRRAIELAKAQDMGLVKIENIHDVPSLYFSLEKLKADVGAELSRADSYGALDERFLSDFDHLSNGPTQKLRAARVAAEILEMLPGFSTATVEEIRDIRKELEPYVVSFRKAIVDISNKIRSAPWDDEFPHEVERELQLRLYPAVAEIEAQVQANSYLKEILHRAAKDPLVIPAASAFGLLLSSATQASTLIAQVASGVAGAGLLAFEAHEAWEEKRRKTESNEFFFYYRASRLLKKQCDEPAA